MRSTNSQFANQVYALRSQAPLDDSNPVATDKKRFVAGIVLDELLDVSGHPT